MSVNTIIGINKLPPQEKLEIYTRLIPPELLTRLNIDSSLTDPEGNNLLTLKCAPGSSTVEMSLRHQAGFPDPILYGHLTDTLNGQIHVLLYILNDPLSPRFDVDRMPDGRMTIFGTMLRNLQAEREALHAGLAPGQVRRGLRLLPEAINSFERFIRSLDHDLYFAEPLYYHNALLFERYGFAYQKGKKLMEHIHAGFASDGFLRSRLDASTSFRQPEAADSIRLRSWAIQDGLLGEPFTDVTMYKRVGTHSGVNTCPDCDW